MKVYDVFQRLKGTLVWHASFAERHEAERFIRQRERPQEWRVVVGEFVERRLIPIAGAPPGQP